jgi:1-acyl-sn-glycerol-3-phosphate acyltransferase
MARGVHFVNWILRGITRIVLRMDVAEFAKVPQDGPLILVGNHVSFIEAPVAMCHLDPRPVTGLGKRQSWENPLFAFLFNTWGIIPIERGTVDREAFRLSVEALEQGKMLAVFPEGTRNYGRLLQAKPGVVALAQRSKVPIVPMAFYGYEDFWPNLKRLRRTDFHARVGKPFRIDTGGEALSREVREAITDEIMCKIAELLPERHRGYYEDKVGQPYRYAVDVE